MPICELKNNFRLPKNGRRTTRTMDNSHNKKKRVFEKLMIIKRKKKRKTFIHQIK